MLQCYPKYQFEHRHILNSFWILVRCQAFYFADGKIFQMFIKDRWNVPTFL